MRLLYFLKHLSENTINTVYDQIEQHPTQKDEFFQDAQEAWIGGVGDFGNPEAAYAIQRHPEYYEYKDALQQSLEQNLGDPFVAYRLLPKAQLEMWEQGTDLPPMGVSVSKKHAEAFRRFAHNVGREDLVLIAMPVPTEAAIMLGHEGEQEIVIDPNWISYHEVQIID